MNFEDDLIFIGCVSLRTLAYPTLLHTGLNMISALLGALQWPQTPRKNGKLAKSLTPPHIEAVPLGEILTLVWSAQPEIGNVSPHIRSNNQDARIR